MAIKDFGESILADVRKRKDEQRRRDEGGTLGKLTRGLETIKGVAEIGQSLGFFGGTRSDKINAFAQNKDVLDTNIRISQAEKNLDFYNSTQEAIEEAGVAANEYFLNRTIEETMDQSLKLPENVQYSLDEDAQKKYKAAYRAQLRNSEKIKEAAEYATNQYEKFGKIKARFSQTGTTEDAMIVAQSKIPSTLKSLGNILTGTDMTQAAVDSFTKSSRAQGAAELEVFNQILAATGGDFIQAVDLAEEAGITEEAKKSLSKTVTEHETLPTGVVISVNYKVDVFGNKTLVEDSVKRVDLRSEKERVAANQAGFNPQEIAAQTLSEQGQKEARRLGFIRGRVKTEEEYNKNVGIVNKLLNETTEDGTLKWIKPTVSETERSRSSLKGTLVANLYSDKDFLRAQTQVRNETQIMEQIEKEIVANNPKSTEEEIKNLLSENTRYKKAASSFNAANELILNSMSRITAIVNETFPLSNPDNAETAPNPVKTTTNEIAITGSSRGARTNNLLNVRPTADKNDPWLGQTGVSSGYAEFKDIDFGIRAGDRVLTTYGEEHKINTIEGVVERFAPAEDNNDTEAYIKLVSNKTGFKRDEEIDLSDSSVRDMLLSAMIKQETGEDVSRDQVRAAVIRANETEEEEVIVTADQVAEAVAKQPTNEDALEWGKFSGYKDIPAEKLLESFLPEITSYVEKQRANAEKIKTAERNKKKNEEKIAARRLKTLRFSLMTNSERRFFNDTGKYPEDIDKRVKDSKSKSLLGR